MAIFDALPAGVLWLEGLIFALSVGFVFVVFNHTVLNDSAGQLPSLNVPTPKQCQFGWKGEVLEEANIKVRPLNPDFLRPVDSRRMQTPGSSAIQCYCPANGQLLGLVNPATPDGIDRAIAKAKHAQSEWAKTTFKQRRRVLQTLLKCVKVVLVQSPGEKACD